MTTYWIRPLSLSDKSKTKIQITLKILTILLTIFALSKFLFPATMEQFTHFTSAWSIGNVIRWFLFGGFIYCIMSVFYKNEKMTDVLKLYILPLLLLSIIFLPNLTQLNLSLTGNSWVSSGLLLANMVIELLLMSSIAVLTILGGGISKRRYWGTLKTFFFVVLITVPLNILEFFKGILSESALGALTYHNFGVWHLLAIFVLIGITVGLYFFLRKKSTDEKWQLLTILSLAFILMYLSKLSVAIVSGYQGKTQWFNMLPLYLCDVGAILIPIAMLSRKKFFLDNLFFVNAVGALSIFVFMGIDSLNGNNYLFSFNYLYFIITHALLFALSIMPVLLKLYKPKFKGILNGIYVFTGLFVVAAIVSSYISTFAFPTDNPEIWIYYLPNYCFTQICPLPLPFNFPGTTIGNLTFNFPYLAILYVFYLAMFFAFQGLWYLIVLIVHAIQKKIHKQQGAIEPVDSSLIAENASNEIIEVEVPEENKDDSNKLG